MFEDLQKKAIRQLASSSPEIVEMGVAELVRVVTPSPELTDAIAKLAEPNRFFRLTPSVRLSLYQICSFVCPEKLGKVTRDGLPIADGTFFTPSAIKALYLDAPKLAQDRRLYCVSSGLLFAGLMHQQDDCALKLQGVLNDDGSEFLETLSDVMSEPGESERTPILCKPSPRMSEMLKELREKLGEVDTRDIAFALVDYKCENEAVLEVRLTIQRMGSSLEAVDRAL